MFPFESVTVNTCPECPARIETAMKSPAVLFEVNASEEDVVVPASLLACWTKCMPLDDTVKLTPLLFAACTLTTTFPVEAPVGTGATMLVGLQLVAVTCKSLNVRMPFPCDAVESKLLPVMVTTVPGAPDVGLMLVMLGAALNVANPAAHCVEALSVALADTVPDVVWIWSSASSLVLGADGTLSSLV